MTRLIFSVYIILLFTMLAWKFAEAVIDQNLTGEIWEPSSPEVTTETPNHAGANNMVSHIDGLQARLRDMENRLNSAMVTIEEMAQNQEAQTRKISELEEKMEKGSQNTTVNVDEWVTSLSKEKIRNVRPRPGVTHPAPSNRRRRYLELLYASRLLSNEKRQKRELTEAEELLIKEKFSDLTLISHKCAFSAVRTQPLLGQNDPQVVTFHTTHTNMDGVFNTTLGVFVTAIPGTYFFSFTMRSFDHKYIGVSLMVNEEPAVAMTTDASDRKVMQTQIAILHLDFGDEVWLLLGPSELFGLYGNDNNYITFNGHLLYPDHVTSREDIQACRLRTSRHGICNLH